MRCRPVISSRVLVFSIAFSAGVLFTMVAPVVAWAAVSSKDVLAAARALTFLEHPPKGIIDVGIAVDANDPLSLQDANVIKSTIGNGLVIGDLTIHARLLNHLDANSTEGIGALLTTGGSMALFREASDVGKALKIMTITTDPACVQAALCTMLIRSDPKIQVFVNPQVADRDGIAFTQTFSLMIKEVR
jgi:hypothetical protein